jgi:hypothetical protein
MVARSTPLCHHDKVIDLAANIDCGGDRVEIVQIQNHHVPGIDTLPSSSRRCPFVYPSYRPIWVQATLLPSSLWSRVQIYQAQSLFLFVVGDRARAIEWSGEVVKHGVSDFFGVTFCPFWSGAVNFS